MKRTFLIKAELGNEFKTEDYITFYIDGAVAMTWFADSKKIFVHLDNNGCVLSESFVIHTVNTSRKAFKIFTNFFKNIL